MFQVKIQKCKYRNVFKKTDDLTCFIFNFRIHRKIETTYSFEIYNDNLKFLKTKRVNHKRLKDRDLDFTRFLFLLDKSEATFFKKILSFSLLNLIKIMFNLSTKKIQGAIIQLSFIKSDC